MEINRERIIIGPNAAFHMLRHFQEVSSNMLKAILNYGHRKSEVQQFLLAPGSRFLGAFAQSIEALLDQLFQYPYTITHGITGNLELSWHISKDEWPVGIGTSSVVPIDVLNEQQCKKLYKEENRGVSLWHLDVNEMPNSSQCTMILKPLDSAYLFITAFPGSSSLPLPDIRMTEEIYATCKCYWERHVFLVIGA